MAAHDESDPSLILPLAIQGQVFLDECLSDAFEGASARQGLPDRACTSMGPPAFKRDREVKERQPAAVEISELPSGQRSDVSKGCGSLHVKGSECAER